MRFLGVPTVADRVAQMVVKQVIEPNLDPVFLADSYFFKTTLMAQIVADSRQAEFPLKSARDRGGYSNGPEICRRSAPLSGIVVAVALFVRLEATTCKD
jgi:hypothetical protein